MAKRPGQFGDGDVAQARKQKTAEGEEESDTGMDVVSTQEHHLTEVQQELPSDPSTSQVESHVEFAVPGIRGSEMTVDRWTPAEHSSFDRERDFPPSSETYYDIVLPSILRWIAGQNNKQISWTDSERLIRGNGWLRDLLLARWEKHSFRDIRRLSERLLYTFRKIFITCFSTQKSYRLHQVHLSPP